MNILSIQKRAISLLGLIGLMSLTLTSCKGSKGEDIFEKPAIERVNVEMQKLKDQLVGAKHGWILEYYPGRTQYYGGFVIALKFNKDGEVLATSQPFFSFNKLGRLEPLQWEKSKYSIGSNRSVTLNFNTFNKAIHYFSDADKSYGGGLGIVYEGDYQFLVGKLDNSKVIELEGVESHRKMRLIRVDEPLENYLNGVGRIMKTAYSADRMYQEHKDYVVGKIGGVDVMFYFDGKSQILHFDTKEGQNIPVEFIYTPKGLRLKEPVFGVKELIWSAKDKCFLAGNSKLIARDDPNYPEFAKYLGVYLFQWKNIKEQSFETEVEFVQAGLNLYLIKGLAIDLKARFDTKKKCFVLFPQIINNGEAIMLMFAQPNKNKDFDISDKFDVGMASELKPGTTDTYIMKNNGVFSKGKSFILVEPKEFDIYKKEPNSIYEPVFIKK